MKQNRKDLIENMVTSLFGLPRSLMGEGNRGTLSILRQYIPLRIQEIETGTSVFDWVIPDEWELKRGSIHDEQGNCLVTTDDCILHVVGYSEPVDGWFAYSDVADKLHVSDRCPGAVPYRTAYFDNSWGFCVTAEQKRKLANVKGLLRCNIESKLEPGSLSIAELKIKGKSKKEIWFTTYICHPSMANDNLSGIIITTLIAMELLNIECEYTYRFIFVPETLGMLTYLRYAEYYRHDVLAAMVVTTAGGRGSLGYKKSFDPEFWLHGIIEKVLGRFDPDFKVYPFTVSGSDERQLSSVGFRIRACSIVKDKYHEYPEYHTSEDDLNYVTSENLLVGFKAYHDLIYELEKQLFYRAIQPFGEPMLSKYGLYPRVGGASVSRAPNMMIRRWILFFADGNTPLEFVAQTLEVDLQEVVDEAARLVEAGLLVKA